MHSVPACACTYGLPASLDLRRACWPIPVCLLQVAALLPAWAPKLPIVAIEPFQLTSFALSLLLVFRTNTSYSRWLEGRKKFGAIITHSRSAGIPCGWYMKCNVCFMRFARSRGKQMVDDCSGMLQLLGMEKTHAWMLSMNDVPFCSRRDLARQAFAWFGRDDIANKQAMGRWLLAFSRCVGSLHQFLMRRVVSCGLSIHF